MDKTSASYTMTITKDEITSTDKRFTLNDPTEGQNCKLLKACFMKSDRTTIERILEKGEKKLSNKTLPRLAFQVFEKQIDRLSDADRENFPIRKDNLRYQGICQTIEEAKQKTGEQLGYITYPDNNAPKFVIHGWFLFSTLLFVQECLKRFGDDGDKFIVEYRDKTEEDQ